MVVTRLANRSAVGPLRHGHYLPASRHAAGTGGPPIRARHQRHDRALLDVACTRPPGLPAGLRREWLTGGFLARMLHPMRGLPRVWRSMHAAHRPELRRTGNPRFAPVPPGDWPPAERPG